MSRRKTTSAKPAAQAETKPPEVQKQEPPAPVVYVVSEYYSGASIAHVIEPGEYVATDPVLAGLGPRLVELGKARVK